MSQTVTVQVPCSPGHLLPTSHLCPYMASFSSHSTRLALETVPGREREKGRRKEGQREGEEEGGRERRGGRRRERERRGGGRREREKGRRKEGEREGRREREKGRRKEGERKGGKKGKLEDLLISFITTDYDLLVNEDHLSIAIVPIQKSECLRTWNISSLVT